jgi:hypothetical protein
MACVPTPAGAMGGLLGRSQPGSGTEGGSMIALQLTATRSPLARYGRKGDVMPSLPKLFVAGDRVHVIGDTDHPPMIVLGKQLDLFRENATDILCTWKAGGRRRYQHFAPAKLIRARSE